MNTFGASRVPVPSTVLASCVLLLLSAGIASAGVGVTSATNGDPLGKPPMEQERILRVGIDVQANEVITTRANDRAHLVFMDGTALTVGPNAQLVIDRFVYDPATKSGDLAINASKGVFRLVGGKISKTNAIVITTPSSSIGIRGGITMIESQSSQTVATFVFGQSMTVSGQGKTQIATRPGSQVTTLVGQAPGQPALAARGALAGVLRQFEASGQATSTSGDGTFGRTADAGARAFGVQNSVPSLPTSPPQATVLVNTNTVTNSVFTTATDLSTATTTSTSTSTTDATSSCQACKRQDIFHGHRGKR